MATIADYVGRTVDVAAFHGWDTGPGGEALLEQSLADGDAPGGEIVSGLAKLCQRFLMVLFTPQGSIKHLPLLGCRFMIDARSGRWRTSADVQQSFYAALLDVKRQLRQEEREDDPDDERFVDARVLGILLSPRDRAVLKLRLTTAAGDARTFLAPVPVPPR